METNPRPPSWKILLAFAVIYFVWGSTFLAIRVGVHEVPPFLLAGIRFFVAGVVLYTWMRLKGVPSPTRPQWTAATLLGALIFVGDAMEEALDDLCAGAGELGLRNVPAFMFQEGYDPVCEQAFREVARLTRGAYCRFAPGAADELGELLRAAAAYAAGGMKALADLRARQSAGALKLIEQLK